jgi:hypothetical protein
MSFGAAAGLNRKPDGKETPCPPPPAHASPRSDGSSCRSATRSGRSSSTSARSASRSAWTCRSATATAGSRSSRPGRRPGSRSFPPRPGDSAGIETRISLSTDDADALHGTLRERGVDVDPEVMRMGDPVPPMFIFRDQDGNSLLVVETP